MDESRRNLYTPVRDQIVAKPSRKPLQQGALQSTSSIKFASSINRSGQSKLSQNKPNKSVTAFANETDVISHPSLSPKVTPFSPSNTLSAVLNHSANNSQVHIESPRKINIPCPKSHLSRNIMDCDSNALIAGGAIDASSTEKSLLKDKNEKSNVDASCEPKLDKKKKMVKVVQSRYKNAASSSKVHSTNSETLLGNTTDTLKRRPSLKRRYPQKSSFSNKSAKELPKPNIPKNKSQPNTSIVKTKFNNVASTPTAAFKTFFEPEMSHIETVASGKVKAETQTDNSCSDKSVVTEEDLEYARNRVLQTQYINMKIQQSAATRHKEAMKMLMVMEEMNQKLREEVYKNERKAKLLQNQKLLDETIDVQRSALGPVINKIEEVKENYCDVANNLDASRHVLPIEDVLVPDNFESNLAQSGGLMSDVSNLLYGRLEECQNLSGQCSKLKEEVCDVNAVLTSSENLSRDMQALSVVQKSLEMQYATEMK